MLELKIEIETENLTCPHCQKPHIDQNEWALKPHQTHRCLECGESFEGSRKAVSYPRFSPEFLARFNLIERNYFSAEHPRMKRGIGWVNFYLCHYLSIARYRVAGWVCYWRGHHPHEHWAGDRWEGTCDRCTEPDRPTFEDWLAEVRQQWTEYFPGDPIIDDDEIPF